MSRCPSSFKHILHMHYKVIMFKIDKQVLSTLSKARISPLSNFYNIYLYFFDDKSSFYVKKLS